MNRIILTVSKTLKKVKTMNLFSAILKLSFVVGCLVVHGGADKTDYCPEFPCGWFPYSPSDPEVKRDVGILMNKYNDVNDRKLSASVEKIRAALMTYSKNYRRYDVFISSQECMVDKCVPLYWVSCGDQSVAIGSD